MKSSILLYIFALFIILIIMYICAYIYRQNNIIDSFDNLESNLFTYDTCCTQSEIATCEKYGKTGVCNYNNGTIPKMDIYDKTNQNNLPKSSCNASNSASNMSANVFNYPQNMTQPHAGWPAQEILNQNQNQNQNKSPTSCLCQNSY